MNAMWIEQTVDLWSVAATSRDSVEDAIRKALQGDADARVFVKALNDYFLTRPITLIMKFMGWQAGLTAGMPYRLEVPVVMQRLWDHLEDVQIRTFATYVVTPYNSGHLMIMAWTDYMDAVRQWH